MKILIHLADYVVHVSERCTIITAQLTMIRGAISDVCLDLYTKMKPLSTVGSIGHVEL